MPPTLSIVIVNYKTPQLTLQCIKSLYAYEPDLDFEVIVVDNDSNDGLEPLLKTAYPLAQWVQMGYNAGFSRANNAGWKRAKGQYILALNSDTYLTAPYTLSHCLAKLQSLPKPEQVVLGCRLVNEDGSYQETLRLEFPGIARELRANPLYILLFDRWLKRPYQGKKLQQEAHYRTGEVAWINGAFWLFHRNIVDKRLLMDEDFFLYGEDIEWCYRVREHGGCFIHYHEATLVHLGSASTQVSLKKHQQITVSDWLYVMKTRGRFYFLCLLAVVLLNIFLDEAMYRWAILRNRPLQAHELQNASIRKWTIQLLSMYAWHILAVAKRKPSSNKTFINCYGT